MKYAYRRNSKRSSTRYRRRRTIRKPTRMAYARDKVKMPYSTRQFVKKLGNIAEKKQFQITSYAQLRNTGVVLSNYSISQGTGRAQRVGNKIFIRYFTIFGYIDENTSSTNMVRMTVAWPKRVDAAIGDMPTTSYEQPWDLDQFSIIKDRLIPLQPRYLAGGSNLVQNTGALSQVPIKMKIPIFKSVMYDDFNVNPQCTLPIIFFWTNKENATYGLVNYTLTTTYTDV